MISLTVLVPVYNEQHLVAGLGLYDDLRWAGAPLKLTVQVAAALVAWQAGWRLEAVALPFLGPLALGPLALPATVLWLTLVTNALNLLDGLDGLAAGQAVLAAAALGAVAWLNGEGGLVVLRPTGVAPPVGGA